MCPEKSQFPADGSGAVALLGFGLGGRGIEKGLQVTIA
jgi:hypothetical protein